LRSTSSRCAACQCGAVGTISRGRCVRRACRRPPPRPCPVTCRPLSALLAPPHLGTPAGGGPVLPEGGAGLDRQLLGARVLCQGRRVCACVVCRWVRVRRLCVCVCLMRHLPSARHHPLSQQTTSLPSLHHTTPHHTTPHHTTPHHTTPHHTTPHHTTPHHTTPHHANTTPHTPGPRRCQAERRLEEEAERVRAYLDESTEPKITQVAEAELIQQQARSRVCVCVCLCVSVCVCVHDVCACARVLCGLGCASLEVRVLARAPLLTPWCARPRRRRKPPHQARLPRCLCAHDPPNHDAHRCRSWRRWRAAASSACCATSAPRTWGACMGCSGVWPAAWSCCGA
jgi:hypothetical protein